MLENHLLPILPIQDESKFIEALDPSRELLPII